MEKVVLITGSETLLGRKLVEKELYRGNLVAAPVSSKKDSSSGSESSRKNLMVLSWNRSSLFSAKTIMREVCRKWGRIDRALIIDPNLSGGLPFSELPVTDIDDMIDREIKGMLYLTRELLQLFQKQDEALLSYIRSGKPSLEQNAAERGRSGFFRDFSDRLLEEKSENIYKIGFINAASNVDICADFILELCESQPEKACGEWLKATDKKSLFANIPIEKRV
jgi:NADP-dependent 3-hydroxy acid dehydrogenase YdfG